VKTQDYYLGLHRQGNPTTFARCWLVTRTDDTVYGFTDYDQNISFDGVTYYGGTGFTPSALAARNDLSVQNMDLAGVLDSSAITEQDLLEGRWDSAQVEVFELNPNELSAGKMILCSGELGNVSVGRSSFNAEMRGITQKLQQPGGEVYTAACPADFGDDRCGLNAGDYTTAGSVTAVSSTEYFRIFTDSSLGQASDYFGAGLVHWLTGDNAGLSVEVRSFASGIVTLMLPMPNRITVNDTFNIVAGCRKRPVDCKTKWASSNYVNFRGFPDIPLNDKILGNAGTTG
jgi:uncharacterized phage protein (TIGR02218 family)